FLTYPPTPTLAAVRSAKKRNPTPCTLPDTKNRLACVSTATLHARTCFCSRAIVAKVQSLRDGNCAPCEFFVRYLAAGASAQKSPGRKKEAVARLQPVLQEPAAIHCCRVREVARWISHESVLQNTGGLHPTDGRRLHDSKIK